jgi:hypothetical protein
VRTLLNHRNVRHLWLLHSRQTSVVITLIIIKQYTIITDIQLNTLSIHHLTQQAAARTHNSCS